MHEEFLQADDGTRTLSYGIEQGSWYRGSRNCSAVPVLGMLGGTVLLAVTGLQGFDLVIWIAWLAAIPLFFASVLCFLRYVAMARRAPEGGPVAFLKRFLSLLALLLIHVGVFVAYIFF